MIEMNKATVQYPGTEQPAVNELSLTFQRGEFVCILGRSGAGKSTLIRTFNALQPLTSGTIYVDKQSLHDMSEEEQRQERARMGMIFQHFHLIPRLSVLQNVLTGAFGRKKPIHNLLGRFTKAEKDLALQTLEATGLLPFKNRRVEALSGGQKQRVAISRALMQQPDIFLGDEPVASLDPSTANEVFQLLKQLHEENDTLTFINVHDVHLAKTFGTRIIGMKEGHVVFDGPPEELTDDVYQLIYATEQQV
ncbi:phosphonate transport system ATP-binding protein [Salsuginibacillus halophilus]|uniref:Phosphonate transport system ATP-binding protein n=1 Tax=Salsuginibacillus halophilus TaxID=517424 RepID=A0A2P8HYL2_9BACI|nr:phosphonate ABC transporter ATP-binding protein [Salsuginibacillus halophilus]PSL51321.1 phosphonate transport system ATP-binding protein [Salsuginibacillus halophilus]